MIDILFFVTFENCKCQISLVTFKIIIWQIISVFDVNVCFVILTDDEYQDDFDDDRSVSLTFNIFKCHRCIITMGFSH